MKVKANWSDHNSGCAIIQPMKWLSLLVLLGLSIIPTFIFFLTIIRGVFVKRPESSYKPTWKFEKLRSKRKLIYSLVVLYCLVYLSCVLWVGYEFTAPFGLVTQFYIIVGVAFLAMMVLTAVYVIHRSQKIVAGIPPPADGSSSRDLLEWQNRYYAESVFKLGPLMAKILLLWFALVGLLGVASVIVAFLSK